MTVQSSVWKTEQLLGYESAFTSSFVPLSVVDDERNGAICFCLNDIRMVFFLKHLFLHGLYLPFKYNIRSLIPIARA